MPLSYKTYISKKELQDFLTCLISLITLGGQLEKMASDFWLGTNPHWYPYLETIILFGIIAIIKAFNMLKFGQILL